MNKIFVLLLLSIVIFSTGCSIKHPIANDYSQYLVKNEGASTLPKTGLDTDYYIKKETVNHRYEFRAAIVGYAHLWIVEFGKILDRTLKSKDVQAAFERLTKNEGKNSNHGYLTSFELKNYEFKNYRTYISLKIALTNGGDEILNKTYNAMGRPQGGKMFWGGSFAMKNAIQQSTKLAIDKILSEFITDINVKPVASN